jgi:hypothetical protein
MRLQAWGKINPMLEPRTFYPARRRGFLFHLVAIGIFLAAVGYGLWQASRVETALDFLLHLLLALVSGVIVPYLLYRLYALQGAYYLLQRDGLRLRWGLRIEEIPADQIEWIRLEHALKSPLPAPAFAWPGAVVGLRRISDGRVVEYMADRSRDLVYIATPQRVYAISPADPGDFILTYQRLTELGSLAPIAQRSVYPASLLARFGQDLPARLFLLASGLVSVAIWLVVAVAVPGRQQIALRFTAQGIPGDYAPAVRLFLLPVLNTFFWLADLVLGMFFYRRIEYQPLSYLVWGTSFFTAALFLAAVLFILRFT